MEKINWWSTYFGEEEIDEIADSIRNKKISQGTVTKEFEEKFAEMLNVPYAIAVPSGTAALNLALMASGITAGDEVLVPDYTAIGTAHAVNILGAKVKFVDIKDTSSPVIDENKIEEKISNKTKVILPVHYNGITCNMKVIKQIALKYDLHVIEDAAQAMFSKNGNEFLGNDSIAGCFSFSVAKIISTGQGGMIITKDKSFYDTMVAKRNQEKGYFDIPSFNYKFTDILSSIGLIQLTRVGERIEKLRKIYNMYVEGTEHLEKVNMLKMNIENGELPLWALAQCEQRDKLNQFLNEKNIYPDPFHKPLHTAGYFGSDGTFPNSDKFAENGLRLPCGPTQPLSNIEYVIDALHEFEKTSFKVD